MERPFSLHCRLQGTPRNHALLAPSGPQPQLSLPTQQVLACAHSLSRGTALLAQLCLPQQQVPGLCFSRPSLLPYLLSRSCFRMSRAQVLTGTDVQDLEQPPERLPAGLPCMVTAELTSTAPSQASHG